MRILELGCGSGIELVKLGVTESDEVTEVDIDDEALVIARQRFPKRAFCAGAAENLPFANASFDRVISNVAYPTWTLRQRFWRSIAFWLREGKSG
jgi:ubiquinone/menaquinone biosynthesis C-methylase UbiE